MNKKKIKATPEDKLFAGMPREVKRLRKQAKQELRQQARRDYLIKQRRDVT